jgi:long-chain-fatty-acid--CoA ligase ACSBG
MGNNSSILKQAPHNVEDADTFVSWEEGTTFVTTERDATVPPKLAKKGAASAEACPPVTLVECLKLACEKNGDKVALATESPCPALVGGKAAPPLPLDQWKTWTYKQYYDEAQLVAKGLIALGHEHHDAVSIFGFNSPEWFLSEIGAICAGGMAAGIYPTDTPDQVHFKLRHSGASVVVVEDKSKYDKIMAAVELGLPKLNAVVCWAYDECADIKRADGSTIKALNWKGLLELGKTVDDALLQKRTEAMNPGHCCALIYTSGTTGNPKAVMISHDNIVYESRVVQSCLPDNIMTGGQQERLLSYLPLSHVAGMLLDIVTPIVGSAYCDAYVTVHFARAYDLKVGSIGDRLRTVHPTMFLGVPRVWEKISEKMKAIGATTKGLKKKIATWAKAKGLAYQQNLQLGGTGSKPWCYGLADTLVLSKVKTALGLDQCKFGFTGAAPITKATLEYFGALGINVNEVYGMSECTGATTWSVDNAHVWGSCGYRMEGMEVRIFSVDPADINKKTECPRAKNMFSPTEEEQGEICFRGRHIMMGYLANPDLGQEHVDTIKKKTAAAIDADGWLHSGDKGCMSKEGMLKITGRYKELIIGAGGENIAPVPIEDNVKAIHDGIANIMMVGDKRKFNVALVTLKAEGATGEFPGNDNLDGHAKKVNSAVTTISGAMDDEKWIKSITDAIKATNADGKCCPSNAAKIQKFTILPRDFSVETNELTSTLKLKRSVVDKKYKDAIDAMYASKEIYVKFPTGGVATEDVKVDA